MRLIAAILSILTMMSETSMAQDNSFFFEVEKIETVEGPPWQYNLYAIEDDKRYIIELSDKEQWYLSHYYKDVEYELDLDGDGINEGIIRTQSGGNCCGPDYFIAKKVEDGFYILLTHEELSGFPEIKTIDRNGQTNIVVYNTSDGVGNVSYEHTKTELELVNGKLSIVSKLYNQASLDAVMDVTSAELQDTKTKQLIYDLDKDGVDDVLDCNYWDRWGAVQCEISTSSKGSIVFGLGCDRLGILQKSSNGLSDLVCDRNSIVKYSPDENRYILEE
jgi:hypothetical protein